MAATHTKKVKHSMLCVAGVYLIDIVDKMFVILHVNVSRLSICCSCWDFFSSGGASVYLIGTLLTVDCHTFSSARMS